MYSNRKNHTAASVCLAILLVVISALIIVTVPGDRALAALSPADYARLSSLRSIGVTIYYPQIVPARFHLASVESREDAQDDKGSRRGAVGRLHPDYVLKYCDHAARCFTVQSIWIVDETGCTGKETRIMPGRSRYFGRLEVCANSMHWSPASRSFVVGRTEYFWLEGDAALNAAQRARTEPPERSRFYSVEGTGLTDREAVAIVASLVPLQ